MKKTAKKIISAVLVLLMVISAIPLSCISGIDWFGVKAVAATYAVGNIVKFGSYPQSEVTDVTLKASLGEASYGITTGYFYYNGDRYYRYTESSTTYFYKVQPIYWRVLSVGSDGIYLLAETVLDQHVYDESNDSSVTWENSSLRSWLNSDFYNAAFNDSEKSAIRTSTLINDGINPGPDTQDKIFVPSDDDMSSAYGLGTESSRIAPASDFAKNKGVRYSGSGASWWLRTRSDNDCAIYVYYSGYMYISYTLDYTDIGVRPALKLNLNSSIAESTSGYVLSFMDSESGETLSGVTVSSDGTTYTSGADGRVTFSKTNLVSNKTLTISKSGYASQTVSVSSLSNTIVNYIFMEPTGSDDPFDFKSLLTNISLGSANVKGPKASLLGHDVSLINLDMGLDLDLVSLNFKGQYDEKNKTYKVILGVSETEAEKKWKKGIFDSYYMEAEDLYDASNTGNVSQLTKAIEDVKKDGLISTMKGTMGVKADVSVSGFFTFDVSDGKIGFDKQHLISTGVTVLGSVEASQDVPFWYICYATFKLGGELGITGTYEIENKGAFTADVTGAIKATVGAGAKILSKSIVSAEIGITGKFGVGFKLPAKSLKESMTITTSLDGYLKVNLFLLSRKLPISLANATLYPELSVTVLGKEVTSSKAKARSNISQTQTLSIEEDDLELTSRDYLNYRVSTKTNLSKAGALTGSFSESAVYPDGSPALIESGDNIIAVWIDDNGTKADADATTLYYSVYSNGTWSAAKPVYENNTADFKAVICSDGTNVYAVWLRATKSFGNSVELEDYEQNSELVMSSFDGSSWTAPVTISDGKGLVTDYTAVSGDYGITIAWAENSAYDSFGEEGENTIYTVTVSDGTAGETVVSATDCDEINSLAVGKIGDSIVAGYCDNGNVNINGTAVTDVSEGEECYSLTYQNNALYYISGTSLYCYDGTDTSLVSDYATNGYKVLNNGTDTALLYAVDNGYKNEIYVSYSEDGKFVSPVALTSYGKHVSEFDAIYNSDGTFTIASDVDNLTTDESAEYPYTTTSFRIDTIGAYTNVSVGESAYYDTEKITGNGVVTFTADVDNVGTADVSKLNVKLCDESGNVLATSTYTDTIKSGESAQVSVDYTLPASISFTKVNMIIEAAGDVDNSDNTASAEYGYADVMVENYAITDNGTVIARVVNQGFEDAENVKLNISKFDEGESNIDTIDVGTLEPGERKSISYDVPEENISFTAEKQRNLFLLKATTDTDEMAVSNNNAELSLYPTGVESITLNKTELELPTGGTYNLYAAVTPLTAFDKSITWITTDTSVADVDETGKVTATGAGTATITAVSSNSDVVANCIVTVSDEKEVVAVTGISLDTEELSMIVGEKKSVTATVSPADATYSDVIWTSGDESIVLVDQTGKIYAVGTGSTEITAKTADGEFTKTVEVEVKTATYTVTWVINGTVTTETYQVGDKIVVPGAPEIAGYEFNGWTPEVPETMPAKDVTYTAVYGIKHVHSYTSAVVSEPTCTAAGMMLYTCVCGDSYTSDIPALGHTAAAAVRENETAATCTSEGSYDEVIYCSVCKTEISRKTGNKIPALGHLDANNDGICERCGAVFNNPCKNASLIASGGSVDYKTKVTLKATASGVPTGYYVAIYDGNTQVARGDNSSVSYNIGSMTSGKTYTVKIVDANGNVQKDASGNALQKDVNISVNSSFIKKLVAFFKGLFGSLPSKTIGA